MPKFVCKNCGYQFESENNHEGCMCPYCGEKKLTKEKSAETLINEQNE